MLSWLDFFLEKLLKSMGRNKLLMRTTKKILLSCYIRKGLERLYRLYAIARFEEGFDPFMGGFFSRPRVNAPSDPPFNVGVSGKNLIDIKGILDKAGVKHWLMFGTFLGVYRDKAIIPYDEDTDLAIYAEDLLKLVSCEGAFHKKGFYLGVGPGEATLYRDGEHTDLYYFHLDSNKRAFGSIKYNASAFETLNEIQFLGHSWRILSEPERWLKYTYGKDWRTPTKRKGVRGRAYGEEFESGDK